MKDDSPKGSQLSCYKEQTDRKMVDTIKKNDPSSSDNQKTPVKEKFDSSNLQNSIDQEHVATDEQFIES